METNTCDIRNVNGKLQAYGIPHSNGPIEICTAVHLEAVLYREGNQVWAKIFRFSESGGREKHAISLVEGADFSFSALLEAGLQCREDWKIKLLQKFLNQATCLQYAVFRRVNLSELEMGKEDTQIRDVSRRILAAKFRPNSISPHGLLKRNQDGTDIICIEQAYFRTVICKGYDLKGVLANLRSRGLLVTKGRGNLVVTHFPKERRSVRMYIISSVILTMGTKST